VPSVRPAERGAIGGSQPARVGASTTLARRSVLVCAAALVAACSPSIVRASGTAAVPTGAPIPTTTTTADPWAVPAVIDATYLNRVLAELDHVDGDAHRDARLMSAVTPRYLELERSIRADDAEVALGTKVLQSDIQQHWFNVRQVPGDRHMRVRAIIPASPPCVFASVEMDLNDFTVKPVTYPPWSIALLPAPPSTTNPTHWVLVQDGFELDGSIPSATRACATN